MKKKHWVLIVIGIVVVALIVFSICRDYYLRKEAQEVYERAATAAREADAALRQYKRTQSSGERLRELEKIHKSRGFTASEKKEARELIDHMQKRADETGYTEGKRFFVQLRREWGLE